MDFGWMPNRHKPGSVIKWPQPHPGMSRLLCYGHQPVPEALTEQQQRRQQLLASSEAILLFMVAVFDMKPKRGGEGSL